jgi:catechol 2,3-dioxygenase
MAEICATLDDLLTAYGRLKGFGIEPVLTLDDGRSTAFYYDDPDHNRVELTVGNLVCAKYSSEFAHFSLEPGKKRLGAHVDPEKMIAARAAGMSVGELHRRACAGELAGS